MSLTRDDVAQAYRIMLDRAASDNEIEYMVQHLADAGALQRTILLSDEFSNRFDAIVKARDALQRPTLIHLHIPKTAGTTLEGALVREKTMQPSAQFHDHMLPKLVAMPLRQRRALRYLHGHLDMNVSRVFGAPHRMLCVLRRPGPRIFSFYRYILRNVEHPSHMEVGGQNLSFGEYLEFSLSNPHHRNEIDNGQLRRLSGNLNDGKFGLSHSYVVPALHAVTHPDMILGYAEHIGVLLTRLRAEGYLSTDVVENLNVAPQESNNASYDGALASFTEQQKAIFSDFTAWDDYFYDLCMNVLPPERKGT